MQWTKLLSEKRLNRPDAASEPGRSPFQQDLDRIVFSAAFRRLAHKTQVHPLAENDHVHTRLTHSVEVASVGRSLGTIVGKKILSSSDIKSISEDTFGNIVQAACLAHDIGNPPFGHSGEDAIGTWFQENASNALEGLTIAEANDLKKFEGNAQGFRILTQLENYRWKGGLQLTYAVLGTFTKYPRPSEIQTTQKDSYVGAKKIGFFDAEKKYFKEIATDLELKQRDTEHGTWCRHPLTFLVEAADDICYAIVDIEDGYELGYLSYEEARSVLVPMVETSSLASLDLLKPKEAIGKLRAMAIGQVISAAADAFENNQNILLSGKFTTDLITATHYKDMIRNAKETAKKKIYWSERKTKIEIAGSEIIGGLLEFFYGVVQDLEAVNWDTDKLTGRSQMIARITGDFEGVTSKYNAWLRVTDFISGMTDRYALVLYRQLKGISF